MDCIKHFKTDITDIRIPQKLNYPFYYEVDPLCAVAFEEIQNDLESLEHNFGLDENPTNPIGKMFGILVVQNKDKKLHYLIGVSGSLQGHIPKNFLVPAISQYDHNAGVEFIEVINKNIEKLENSSDFKSLKETLERVEMRRVEFRAEMSEAKKRRSLKRKEKHDPDLLIKESLHYKHQYGLIKKEKEDILDRIEKINTLIDDLKKQRKLFLSTRQQQQLDSFRFYKNQSESKSLLELFKDEVYSPPAGTGDCAAPKLLNYAFKNQLKPIALAEFWWGAPHKSMIKKHKSFYPACTSRCKPILKYMLEELEVSPNPMLENKAIDSEIEVIFEDQEIIVINKPHGLLSVDGINIKDSVHSRIKKLYPKVDSPFIVHRLDQETSGLMLIGKSHESCKALQKQFISRKVEKRYIALIQGKLENKEGSIDLPLMLDFNNRPRQMVSHQNGKKALTHYRFIKDIKENSLVYLYPKTGRTHQLRVHCAYYQGLNSPIIGDTLYGVPQKRLCLHAQKIEFNHPKTKERLSFESKIKFD